MRQFCCSESLNQHWDIRSQLPAEQQLLVPKEMRCTGSDFHVNQLSFFQTAMAQATTTHHESFRIETK